jgi:hypothetical protein
LLGLALICGKAPLWQDAHCAVTTVCVWFQELGFQALTLWQLKQLVRPTGMCVALLPVAVLPLWQEAQLVLALKPLWSTPAPAQVLVL